MACSRVGKSFSVEDPPNIMDPNLHNFAVFLSVYLSRDAHFLQFGAKLVDDNQIPHVHTIVRGAGPLEDKILELIKFWIGSVKSPKWQNLVEAAEASGFGGLATTLTREFGNQEVKPPKESVKRVENGGSISKRPKIEDSTDNTNISPYRILRSHLQNRYDNIMSKHFTPLVLSYLEGDQRKTTKDLSVVSSILNQRDCKHFVLVKGSTGVGKTEFLKQLSYNWAKEKLLNKSNLVFLLCLNKPEVYKIDSVTKLIEYFYRYKDSEVIKFCAKKLEEEQGKSVTFLLDGYDEYPKNDYQDSFIDNIIHRHILLSCSIVISSRPCALLAMLRSNSQFEISYFQFEIIGFDDDGQKDFIQNYLAEDTQSIDVLEKCRKTNPITNSHSSVPFYLSVFVSHYNKLRSKLPGIANSVSLQNVFICYTMHRYVSEHNLSLDEGITDITDFEHLPKRYNISVIIHELSKLAFEGLRENNQIFSLCKIESTCPEIFKISQNHDHLGFDLLQFMENYEITNSNPMFSFIFPSVQEFLAACYMLNLPITGLQDKKVSVSSILNVPYFNDSYLNMFSFCISLMGSKVKQEALNKVASDIAQGSKSNDHQNNDLSSVHFKNVLLYQCFRDEDSEMCKIVEKNMFSDRINITNHILSSNDMDSIGRLIALSSVKEWKLLNLASCDIQDEGINAMYKYLTPSVKIKKLGLYNNSLTPASSRDLVYIVNMCRIESLFIGKNHLTENLFYGILCSSSLKVLGIDDNILLSDATVTLFTLLKENKTNLEQLDICNAINGLPEIVYDHIAEALQVNHTLKKLNMCDNDMPEKAIHCIVTALRDNETLGLLMLPVNKNYSDNYRKDIKAEESVINEKRKYGLKLKIIPDSR